LAAVALALLASQSAFAQATAVAAAPAGQEMRFADQIKAMLDGDRAAPPPQNAILFIGSSIFRQWAGLKEQMAPLPVFNRAFGGSRTWEVLHYLDQIVLPYRPRIIVYYTGSNDVNAGQPAQAIVARTMEFMTRAHAALPAARIYYVAINRSPDKRDKWDVVDAVNAQMKAAASSTSYLRYIDLNPVLFKHGEPRMELYRPDGLHFHPPAYEEFTGIIKPVLTQAWSEIAK
jgi:lysophospholipase L1-like esterase